MKLAHIAPTKFVYDLPLSQTAHLALSSLVVSSTAYRNFYQQESLRNVHVILDNPVHEDQKVSPSDWLAAAKIVRPAVAVIPDVIDDPEQTIVNAKELAGEMSDSVPGIQLMVVPHAIEHADFVDCAAQLIEIRGVSFIGLTLERRLKDDGLAYRRRRRRLELLTSDRRFRDIKYHYLGISEESLEFCTEERDRVFSADTSKFATRFLTQRTVTPPSPVTSRYLGRKALGGSTGFFYFDRPHPWTRAQEFTRNLAKWSAYAEGRL